MTNPDPKQSPWRALFLASVIGVDFALCVLLGFWIGQGLARIAGGHPLWLVAGLMIGLFLGGVTVYLLIKPFREE